MEANSLPSQPILKHSIALPVLKTDLAIGISYCEKAHMYSKFLLICALGSLLAAVTAALAASVLASSKNEPTLSVEPMIHDFGRVSSTAPLKARLQLRNETDLAIYAIQPHTSCDCVAIGLKTDRLDPGGSATVDIEIRPPRQAGVFERIVIFEFQILGSKARRRVTVRFLADVILGKADKPISQQNSGDRDGRSA